MLSNGIQFPDDVHLASRVLDGDDNDDDDRAKIVMLPKRAFFFFRFVNEMD